MASAPPPSPESELAATGNEGAAPTVPGAVPIRGRAAIFGGSFDPVHRGHLEMARTARKALALDRVVFSPCHRSPFKEQTAADARQRLAMLRFALADEFSSTGSGSADVFEISTWELERPRPSYSWETVEHFRRGFPETEWHWILGSDQWEAIDRWAEPERLRRQVHFIVMQRGPVPPSIPPGWRVTAVPFEHPASSTAIRAAFEARKGWLSPSVAAFCERERLYG